TQMETVCVTVLCLKNSLKVRPGESVTLTCLNPKHTKPPAFMWSRPDMQSHGYVFFYRQSYSVDSFQHPSYCGRVELRDPEMKLGDVSVTLKNVTFNDTGTYQCKIIVSSRRKKRDTPEVISVVNLKVEDPGEFVEFSVSSLSLEQVSQVISGMQETPGEEETSREKKMESAEDM
uniref:Ig-like domain-containing protein n=1 Tax=Lates calcarifer TaxID=8187 RepID=A0A4W6DZJ7_LATCA